MVNFGSTTPTDGKFSDIGWDPETLKNVVLVASDWNPGCRGIDLMAYFKKKVYIYIYLQGSSIPSPEMQPITT